MHLYFHEDAESLCPVQLYDGLGVSVHLVDRIFGIKILSPMKQVEAAKNILNRLVSQKHNTCFWKITAEQNFPFNRQFFHFLMLTQIVIKTEHFFIVYEYK